MIVTLPTILGQETNGCCAFGFWNDLSNRLIHPFQVAHHIREEISKFTVFVQELQGLIATRERVLREEVVVSDVEIRLGKCIGNVAQ